MCAHLGLILVCDRRSGEVCLIQPNFLRTLLVCQAAAFRSRAAIQNSLTKICGLGQTAKPIRGEHETDTTDTLSESLSLVFSSQKILSRKTLTLLNCPANGNFYSHAYGFINDCKRCIDAQTHSKLLWLGVT